MNTLQISPPRFVIHAAAAAAAGIGGGLAQLPGSDAPFLMGIQSVMILAIADHYHARMTQAAAAEMVLTFCATMAGRCVSQLLLGWIPGAGNFLNALTACAITEALGWMAVRWFKEER